MGSTTTIEISARFLSLLQQCGQPNRILDAGCGDCVDIGTLRTCFPHAMIVGVDFDSAALRFARDKLSSLCLIQADLNHLPLRAKFDLIVVRHPDIDRRTNAWRSAFTALCNVISPTGLLLVTAYTADEMPLIQTVLSQLQSVPLNITALNPVSMHGRDKVAGLFRLPDTLTVR